MKRYNVHQGIQKLKTKTVIAITTSGLILGAGGLSLAIFGTAHAVSPPTWDLDGAYTINFEYLGSHYIYSATISNEDSSGNFNVSGTYPVGGPTADSWSGTGNVTASAVTFSVNYTTGAPTTTHMDMTGTIASDASMSGNWTDNYGGARSGSWATGTSAAQLHCKPTGFFRDGINMTARDLNPTAVSGNVDATGCNIGVYFGPGHNGSVNGATISGSNYYGVVVQKAKVDVKNSNIHDIGETPLNGDQHGVGIYYATVAGLTNGDCTTGTTKGDIVNNSVWNYQKGGIVASCTGTDVSISGNTVQGQGPVDYIAQNGIQVGYGADASVENNIVTGNAYSGAGQASSGGILVVGGACYSGDYTTGVDIRSNTMVGNDVGVYLSNLDAHCAPSSTKTNIDVSGNTIADAGLTNTTGNGATQGYQAGVSDQGDKDKISNNRITGSGYNPANSSSSIFTTWIDVSATNHAKVHANRTR